MTRAEIFIRTHLTNADRKPREQLAIYERGEWVMARLKSCPLRLRELEPFVLSLSYLFFDTFRSAGKNLHELTYICSEALRAAKSTRSRPLNDADEWVTLTLENLLKKKLLRKTGARITVTDAGDAKIAAIESARPVRDPHAERLVLVPAKRKRSKYRKSPDWFAVALNHLKDGMHESAIARQIGIARSTLSESRDWRNAKKALGIPTRRRRIY